MSPPRQRKIRRGSATGNIRIIMLTPSRAPNLGFYIKLTGDVPTSTLAGRKQEKFFSLVEEIFHIQGVAAEGGTPRLLCETGRPSPPSEW